ncbi:MULTISPECIES: helix-turn-helix domain-containing protein [unclassified Photorhabdus]|uniref:helix-turn-helix domain-containing protein n=1 Tax=unclassified Photorhabdus TaxID=2620880 RepID=UPI000DCDF7F1|nr:MULTISPECIES: XRE family transcriptional regulator [unclassified Photorhabdus]RAW91607.1 peptidase [Photorhabdus sp. S9-53]RAW91612.1 peptidase [Photorhabdus sp. S10-54]RAW95218.1 peptidase [Photorhabdus sp. S8-52]
MTFAKRLKEAMRKRDFTQSSLAKEVEMAQSMIWKLTTGKAQSTTRIVDLARVLGVRPEWLSDGSGPMYPDNSPASVVVKCAKSFPVKIYDANSDTGDTIMIPGFFESSDTYRAYRITQNTGCAEATEGSLIVIDSSEKAANDDLVYARIGENYSVYRFVQGGAFGFLSVDDTRVPLTPINSDVELVGVIVYLFRDMKRRR